MNERIQELAYEAEDYADGVVDQGGEFHPAYTQKLAELIVQECAQQCWTVSELESKGFVVSECAKKIRKHFGVEE
jgi:hypothetical protein